MSFIFTPPLLLVSLNFAISSLLLSSLIPTSSTFAQQNEDYLLVCGKEDGMDKVWYLDLKASLSGQEPVVIGELYLRDETGAVITSTPLGLATDGGYTFWVSFEDNTVRQYSRCGKPQKIDRINWYKKNKLSTKWLSLSVF